MSSIGSVCRSRSSLSLAPRCTAVYTTLLPGISVTTASRSRMLPLAVNYDPLAAIKLSFPATTRARSVVGPSLSLAQRSGLTARLNCCNSRDHRTYLKVFLVEERLKASVCVWCVGKAYRECTADGRWWMNPDNRTWSNYTQCINTDSLVVCRTKYHTHFVFCH